MDVEYTPTMKPLAQGETVIREATWTQKHPSNSSYSAYLTGLFEVYVYDGFRQVEKATVGSGLSAGLNSADWIETNSIVQSELPALDVNIAATGHFTATVNTSTGGSISIPGFSVTGSSGTTYQLASTPMTISKTFSVY